MEEPGWDMGVLVCALRGDETDPPVSAKSGCRRRPQSCLSSEQDAAVRAQMELR